MECSSHALHSLFAGGLGGAVATVFSGYPLDTLKVRLQSQPLRNETEPRKYNGMIDCIRKTVHQEGLIGLYRGMSVTLMTNTPVMASYFFGYNVGLGMVASDNESRGPRPVDVVKAGIFAGFFSGLVSAPGDRIKCLLQVGSDASRRPLKMLQFVYQQKGIIGLYRGVTGAIVREVPACTGYFVGLEISRDLVLYFDDRTRPDHGRAKLSSWQSALAGIGGGFMSCLVGLPGDVIKARQQSAPVDSQPKSVVFIFKELWNQEGIKGLYRGGTLVMVRLVPTSGMCFFIYDNVMKFLDGDSWTEDDLYVRHVE